VLKALSFLELSSITLERECFQLELWVKLVVLLVSQIAKANLAVNGARLFSCVLVFDTKRESLFMGFLALLMVSPSTKTVCSGLFSV